MFLCKVFLMLFFISLIVACYSAFRLSTSMKTWINKAFSTASIGLTDLAKLSTVEALRVLASYLGVGAAAFFLIAIQGDVIGLGNSTRDFFGIVALTLGYTALSIRGWDQQRQETLNKFIAKTKDESIRYSKYYAFLSILILITVLAISAYIGEAILNTFGSFVLLLLVGGLCILGSILIANTIAILFVFAPAIAAIAFLWIVIFVARGALFIGKRHLVNFLTAYAILGNIYFVILSFPVLRAELGLPVFCW